MKNWPQNPPKCSPKKGGIQGAQIKKENNEKKTAFLAEKKW